MVLPGSVLSQNVTVKTFTLKQERKVLINGQIYVKWTPKRTTKTLLSIISPLALPALNYEERMTKDVGTKTASTLF